MSLFVKLTIDHSYTTFKDHCQIWGRVYQISLIFVTDIIAVCTASATIGLCPTNIGILERSILHDFYQNKAKSI